MSAESFISDGRPANANPYASTEQTVLPDYYTDAAMQAIANQQALAGRPLPVRQNPPIADFSELQKTAIAQTPGAANAYQPYLAQAGRNTADVTQQFMNPYTEQVVNRIGQMGTRALNEQILPGIEGSMIRAGQFGGTAAGRADGSRRPRGHRGHLSAAGRRASAGLHAVADCRAARAGAAGRTGGDGAAAWFVGR
jgi:hypothetical protein